MNKAFIREPDLEGRVYCPRCGSLATSVGAGPLDTYVRGEARMRLQESAWFCSFGRCDVAYFSHLGSMVTVDELVRPIYPKDLDAPICVCFGFGYEDVVAEVDADPPLRLRELLAKTRSDEAHCAVLAPDGRCCSNALQELFVRLRGQGSA
jgi:hypothetical protein